MSLHAWLMYLTLVLVATSTPGPAVLFIMTNSTLYGWRKAVFAALGNIVGLLCLGVMAVAGLGALIKTSVIVFDVIKYAGAAYLIYLGLKSIFQRTRLPFNADRPATAMTVPGYRIFVQAFGVAVSNPKAIVFLTALFPQFIILDRALIPQFSQLIATLMLFSFCFLMAYALLAHQAKGWLSNARRLKLFNRASGSIFIGFGVLLATTSNR
jgi:homoserine/homoserine lactone efflux protein